MIEGKWRFQAIAALATLTFLLGCLVVWELYSTLIVEKRPVPLRIRQAGIVAVPKIVARPKAGFIPPKAGFIPFRRMVRVAIILDDAGGNFVDYNDIFSIDAPLTISVLPNMPGSLRIVDRARASGKEAILHLPMEPINGVYVRHDGSMVLTSMNDDSIKGVVTRDLATVPGVVGVNNHMGSKATEDPRVMDDVLSVIKEKGLFFVDSRTAHDSVAYDRAKAEGVRAAKNVIFLDVFQSEEAVEKKIGELVEMARQNGGAIGIGHATRINTVTALMRMIPEYKKQGVEFVFASALVK